MAGENVTLLKPGESMHNHKVKERPKKISDDFEFLLKVKGIGKETLEDIKKIYPSLEDLKKALKEKKVPLRNDIVKKLKKTLLK